MKKAYIGNDRYRVRWFRSPLGFTKVLIDTYVKPGYINLTEYNDNVRDQDDAAGILHDALVKIAEIESYK